MCKSRSFIICFDDIRTKGYSTNVPTAADNLARNLKQLREARGLTQAQVAKLAGVPRPTWSSLESGGGNPTLAVLIKVANALALTLEELLSAPREACRLYRAKDLLTRERAGGQGAPITLRQLLPDALPGLSLERLAFPAGARMTGVPHRAGTREYLACESGTLQLTVAGQEFVLAPGDVVVFRGDQKHAYANLAEKPTVAYSAVLLSA